MKRHHLYTFALLLGALSLMVAGLDHWADALKPQFIAGTLATIAAVLKGMYQGSPNEEA